MPRAIWKGSIAFGLVSIPVEVHTAVRDHRPRFRMLHARDQSPVRYERVCQREGLFRLERDRRGQIRVFPGTALQTASMSAAMPAQTTEEQRQEESYEAEPVGSSDHEEESNAVSAELAGQAALGDGGQAEFGVEESVVSEPNGNVMDAGDRRAPVRGRRTRKAPTAGKPPARKSTGARASTRRRKTPVRA